MNDEVIGEFLVESYESLERIDTDLLELERGNGAPDLVASIFRGMHTIKGTCGFLGFSVLETVSHRGENLLALLRDGVIEESPEIVEALFETVDAMRAILGRIQASGDEGTQDYGDLLARLEGLSRPNGGERPAKEAVKPRKRAGGSESDAANRADTTIRVDVDLLDRVMNLVGELVLARNRILRFAPEVEDTSFANASQRLNLLTTELQEGVMKTRMQPIGNVWNKLPRVVRDLCHACGKSVELELDGTETELDRTIIEAIKDPLTHAVRNALDHGIEAPAVRTAAGKPEKGRLCLRAYHEGGQVNIEVSDDGGGIDPEKIRARAIDRGLVSAERAASLTERETLHFIFHPGFSTAANITNVSGRGVGMDVVKTNVEKIGGSVDISSTPGFGTTLKIKIPLTLAIIPALIVKTRGQRFAIPQVNLLELVRLEGEQAKSGVERLYGSTLYRLRGDLLPLVFLDQALQLEPAQDDGSAEVLNIVVLQADDRQFGLVVDSISDTEEIVVKPLGKELKGLNAYAGATIMGDGRVALILDVLGLASNASLLSGGKPQPGLEAPSSSSLNPQGESEPLLLFSTGPDQRMAMPLSFVARLEEISASSLETAGGEPVVQYRNAILPLHDLRPPAHREREAKGSLHVVVCRLEDQSLGLLVDTIIDTVDEVLPPRFGNKGSEKLGAAVIQGRVTDLLDVEAILRSRCGKRAA